MNQYNLFHEPQKCYFSIYLHTCSIPKNDPEATLGLRIIEKSSRKFKTFLKPQHNKAVIREEISNSNLPIYKSLVNLNT